VIDTANLTASQIDELKCAKEKELLSAQDNLHKIEVEELEIGKQIVLLQVKRKDLQIAISKARQIVRTLSLDTRILTSKFWAAKDNR
jgi:uncharacterized ferredoxin-like protein